MHWAGFGTLTGLFEPYRMKTVQTQLGSKAASDSTLKQLTLAGYQILVLYFYFTSKFRPAQINLIFAVIFCL